MDPPTTLHGGRSYVKPWVSNQIDPGELRSKRGRPLTFLSFNVLCDAKCVGLRYSTTKKWEKRCVTLIEEIRSYDADIVCLQDLDRFDEWWRVQLMVLGYDSMFKRRTQKRDAHYEGVAIAYKRDLFQLFKSVPINLNGASELESARSVGYAERLICDDVALLLFLQPWKTDFIESAVMVASIQFAARETDTEVRYYQAEYFTKQMELANREFHLPVIVGASLYDSPNSPAYHVLRTGRTQLKPNAPPKVSQPSGRGYCRGSVRITWYAPKMGKADPPIHSYRIAWRPGGSLTLGFRAQIIVPVGAALQYGEKINAAGVKKSFVMEEMAFNIIGLSSELPFEFIVAAVNDEGQGQWSDPSMPIVMVNPPKNPRQAPLKYLRDEAEVGTLRECFTMQTNDWDVEIAINSNPVTAQTQLTPRTVTGIRDLQVPRGKATPLSVNPREGWRDDLCGQADERVLAELSSIKSIYNTALRGAEVRDPSLFNAAITDSPRSKRAIVPQEFALSPCDHLGRPKWSLRQSEFVESPEDEDDARSYISEISGFQLHGREGDAEDDAGHDEEKSIASRLLCAPHDPSIGQEGASQMVLAGPRLELGGVGAAGNDGIGGGRLVICMDDAGLDNEPVTEDRRGAIFQRVATLVITDADDGSESGFESKVTDKDGESSHSSIGSNKLRAHSDFLRMRGLERQKAALEAEAAEIAASNLAALRDTSRAARRLNDDTVLDGAELVRNLGRPDPRQKHNLSLRSAYESYSAGGEPLFTQSLPGEGEIPGVACSDYIFYSGHQMFVLDVLSLPHLNQLRGDNPQTSISHADPYWQHAPSFCNSLFNRQSDLQRQAAGPKAAATGVFSKSQLAEAKRLLGAALERSLAAGGYVDIPNRDPVPDLKVKERPPTQTYWGGAWMPTPGYNPRRCHSWLPNDTFCSSHMAIGARLDFIEGSVAALWR